VGLQAALATLQAGAAGAAIAAAASATHRAAGADAAQGAGHCECAVGACCMCFVVARLAPWRLRREGCSRAAVAGAATVAAQAPAAAVGAATITSARACTAADAAALRAGGRRLHGLCCFLRSHGAAAAAAAAAAASLVSGRPLLGRCWRRLDRPQVLQGLGHTGPVGAADADDHVPRQQLPATRQLHLPVQDSGPCCRACRCCYTCGAAGCAGDGVHGCQAHHLRAHGM
jgi:hypothetical protein